MVLVCIPSKWPRQAHFFGKNRALSGRVASCYDRHINKRKASSHCIFKEGRLLTPNNVIQFPKELPFPTTKKDCARRLMNVRKQFCDEIAMDAIENIRMMIINYGYPLKSGPEYEKDWMMLYEAFSGLLYRSANIQHPLHRFTDDMIRFADEVPKKPAKRMRRPKPIKED